MDPFATYFSLYNYPTWLERVSRDDQKEVKDQSRWKLKLIIDIKLAFQAKIKSKLQNRFKSFYLIGSFAYNKINLDKPDINFLIIFDGNITPKDYLAVGQICRCCEERFANIATIRFEFRPFRYIKPRSKNDFEVSINPILISTSEVEALGGVITNKWITAGLKNSHQLLFGKDYLFNLRDPVITHSDLKKSGIMSLVFFSIPLSRAPAQYTREESNLLLSESLTSAKNIACLGIEAAMTEVELANKEFLKFIENKEMMPNFYKQHYGEKAQQMVSRVLEIREKYSAHKHDQAIAEEIFTIALNLSSLVRNKILSL